MKNKILELVELVSKDKDLNKMNMSLTLNYTRVIESVFTKNLPFNLETLEEKINSNEKITSFNFTLSDMNPTTWSETQYDKYWYKREYIFHGEKKVLINFSFISTFLSISNLRDDMKFDGDFKKIKLIGKTYLDSSKSLYKAMN